MERIKLLFRFYTLTDHMWEFRKQKNVAQYMDGVCSGRGQIVYYIYRVLVSPLMACFCKMFFFMVMWSFISCLDGMQYEVPSV